MPPVEKSRLKADFNRAAGKYDSHALLQKNVAHNLFSLAIEKWPGELRVLDAGAGTGFFSRFASLNRRKWSVLALDIAYRMCELAGRQPRTTAINADMEALPLNDNSVDAIFSSLALQWVGEPAKALQESCRVLKSGKEMLFATIATGTLQELAECFAAIGEPDRVGVFTAQSELENWVKKAGFDKVEVSLQPITLHYPDVIALLHSIKQIGAASKRVDRNRKPLKRAQLKALQDTYAKKYSENNWLTGTWNIAYVTAKKP